MDLIASMHEDEQRGEIEGTLKELCQVARCSHDEFIKAMTEMSEKKVAEIKPCPPYVPLESLKFHIKNRRMSHEFTQKAKERKKKQKQRVRSKNNDCPEDVPHDVPDLSPTMSRDFPPERLEVRGKRLDNTLENTILGEGEVAAKASHPPPALKKSNSHLVTKEFWEKLKTNPSYQKINLEVESGKMDAWLAKKVNARRRKTEGFVLNWLNRSIDDLNARSGSPREDDESLKAWGDSAISCEQELEEELNNE